jgi:hypothetical protein
MGLKAHAPSAKTGRNNGDTCFIEQMAGILDAFDLERPCTASQFQEDCVIMFG